MKKIAVLMLAMALFIFCNEREEGFEAAVDYSGEYYICFQNSHHALFTWGQYHTEFKEDRLVKTLGELKLLKIDIYKVVGEAYPDRGDLILNVYDDGDLIKTLVAPLGTSKLSYEIQL